MLKYIVSNFSVNNYSRMPFWLQVTNAFACILALFLSVNIFKAVHTLREDLYTTKIVLLIIGFTFFIGLIAQLVLQVIGMIRYFQEPDS